ncbi:MAG: FAD-dependent oxidoreductase [Pseudomonadota bacterium]
MLMKNGGAPRPLDIAVIGTGIAGMSAAWLIAKQHDVTVYEKNERLGGHSNTVDVATSDGIIPVDTGFIVFNDWNYPNLEALFDHLGVGVVKSDMSFSASIGDGALEYSGDALKGLLGQRRNVFKPRHWRMIRDILRFYREAPDLLRPGCAVDMTLGAYLSENRYSDAFIQDHLLPMGAAIWSTKASDMLDYPVMAFIAFFQSHGLLNVNLNARPKWMSVRGGSRSYVNKLTAGFRDRARIGCGVESIQRDGEKVIVTDLAGDVASYDHVVIAAHADETLSMLSDADADERAILGSFNYTDNLAILHKDPSLMPRRHRVWSSWNYVGARKRDDEQALCVTYWMNKLQSLPCRENIFVTLNPVHEPDPSTVVASFDYQHPLFNEAALAAQKRLWQIQGARRTWFCGSYFGYGFHEDALQSGLAAAEAVTDMKRPWSVGGESDRIANALAPRIAAE